MSKKFKCVSHVERVLNRDYGKHVDPQIVNVEEVYEMKKIVKDGRVSTVTEKVLKDPRKNVEGFKVSDFSIDMLQLTGAIVNLKPVTLDGGNMNMVDSFVSNLESIE